MASAIEICNSALIRLGANTITSFTDNTTEAKACNQIYERVRDAVLVAHPWNFALVRESLAKLSSIPSWGYANEFQLPVNCLRVVEVQDKAIKYEIEGRKILANIDPFNIKYISQVTSTGYFSNQFREALEKKLALELAFLIVQSSTQQQLLQQEYDMALADARSFDAQEGGPESYIYDDFINSRVSGVDFGEI